MESDGESKLEKSVEAVHKSFLSFHGKSSSTMIERNPQKWSIKLKLVEHTKSSRTKSDKFLRTVEAA